MTPAPTRRRKIPAGGLRPKRLTALELGEVSCVDAPANTGARHLMFKNLAALETDPPAPGQHDPDLAPGLNSEDPEAVIAALTAALAERNGQLAFLAERMTGSTPPESDPAGDAGGGNANSGQDPVMSETMPPGLAEALAKAGEDSHRRLQAALSKQAEDHAAGIAKAAEDLRQKLQTADNRRPEQTVPSAAPAPTGEALLREALERARAEARRHAAANPPPLPSGYWRAALAVLGARLEPALNPHDQLRAALQSEDGKVMVAAATGDMRRLSG